jgi:hypothetical protein
MIVTFVVMTIDGVWIGNQIYCVLLHTAREYTSKSYATHTH